MERLYLVTGAAGHLGNTVVRKLVSEGKKVRALVLPDDSLVRSLPENVECIFGDVRDKTSLKPFFETDHSIEKVLVHAAGIVTIASAYDQLVYDVNVTGTQNVLDLSMDYAVKRVVHVSSVHAIPELPRGQVMTEIKHFDPEKLKGLYSRTKSEATAYALACADKGLDLSVVHPSGISGPYDSGRGHLTQMLIDYYKGSLFMGVNGGYDFVDVRDVANGIISCIDNGRKGECYILSNQYYSVPEVLNMFHDITGKKPVKLYLPLGIAKATAPLAELYYKILKQPPLYTPYSLFVLSSNANFSHEKATRELGYTTRPFDETVRDSVEWLKQIKRI